eukprot:CAMPEP_0206273510 /NCGR_PEP_ID=MMETSP0047_2-20121206/34640_1 /ASSEMBLY_ACC=CAM_ASM_000192 /TAXON_ID=195065 /ORGANISM="Chroomonas mesostigmatica_cf, Strain CCMP1168" /LENGTH=57 /DNA_ID=CAMNT_0053702623 /DNA_START=57 /DNA_END=227 /DNA_ORIENTATION=+
MMRRRLADLQEDMERLRESESALRDSVESLEAQLSRSVGEPEGLQDTMNGLEGRNQR